MSNYVVSLLPKEMDKKMLGKTDDKLKDQNNEDSREKKKPGYHLAMWP